MILLAVTTLVRTMRPLSPRSCKHSLTAAEPMVAWMPTDSKIHITYIYPIDATWQMKILTNSCSKLLRSCPHRWCYQLVTRLGSLLCKCIPQNQARPTSSKCRPPRRPSLYLTSYCPTSNSNKIRRVTPGRSRQRSRLWHQIKGQLKRKKWMLVMWETPETWCLIRVSIRLRQRPSYTSRAIGWCRRLICNNRVACSLPPGCPLSSRTPPWLAISSAIAVRPLLKPSKLLITSTCSPISSSTISPSPANSSLIIRHSRPNSTRPAC